MPSGRSMAGALYHLGVLLYIYLVFCVGGAHKGMCVRSVSVCDSALFQRDNRLINIAHSLGLQH